VQAGSADLGQIHKAKGLEASLGGPHGKHHLRAAADAGVAEVEQNCHPDAFVERLFD